MGRVPNEPGRNLKFKNPIDQSSSYLYLSFCSFSTVQRDQWDVRAAHHVRCPFFFRSVNETIYVASSHDLPALWFVYLTFMLPLMRNWHEESWSQLGLKLIVIRFGSTSTDLHLNLTVEKWSLLLRVWVNQNILVVIIFPIDREIATLLAKVHIMNHFAFMSRIATEEVVEPYINCKIKSNV